MYEDSWYNLVPDHTQKKNTSTSQPYSSDHRRQESLLQHPTIGASVFQASSPLEIDLIESRLIDVAGQRSRQPGDNKPLERLFDDPETSIGPPEPTLRPRPKSYSDFYHIVRAQLSKDKDAAKTSKSKTRKRRKNRGISPSLDALMITNPEDSLPIPKSRSESRSPPSRTTDAELVKSSQREYL